MDMFAAQPRIPTRRSVNSSMKRDLRFATIASRERGRERRCRGGPAGTGCCGVSMAGGREGQGARKGNGVRGHRLPSPPWVVSEFA